MQHVQLHHGISLTNEQKQNSSFPEQQTPPGENIQKMQLGHFPSPQLQHPFPGSFRGFPNGFGMRTPLRFHPNFPSPFGPLGDQTISARHPNPYLAHQAGMPNIFGPHADPMLFPPRLPQGPLHFNAPKEQQWERGSLGFSERLETTKAKIDFYSERLKQLAGSSFKHIEKENNEATGQGNVSSSSKETKNCPTPPTPPQPEQKNEGDKSSKDLKVELLDENDKTGDEKEKAPVQQQEEHCVPDSSNTETEEEQIASDSPDEQHSSGSVDEELLDDEIMEAKTNEESEVASDDKSPTPSPNEPPPPNSLVGELMSKFGFNDILEYQEAYRKAVQESRASNSGLALSENNNEQKSKTPQDTHKDKDQSSLKLRNDIAISPEANFANLSNSAFSLGQHFETLKRLRPDFHGGQEHETLWCRGGQ